MIKCEVVFDGQYIKVNGYILEIYESYGFTEICICKDGKFCDIEDQYTDNDNVNIEQAIKWCLEN